MAGLRLRHAHGRRSWAAAAALLLVVFGARSALAGAFIFADDVSGADVITHPIGYSGAGGPLFVDVCIQAGSPFAAEMEFSVQQAIERWNARTPTVGNLHEGSANDVPSVMIDFESLFLHELGHCIGLDHPNVASESGLATGQQDYTRALPGGSGWDVDAGPDGVIGSADDLRGDDENVHWFEVDVNDPFQLAPVVDSTSYSRFSADLPLSHSYAANGNRSVAAALGLPPTEAVMNQETFYDEAQRHLVADDIATLRLAGAGLDGFAGTSDDHQLVLRYGGRVPNPWTEPGCDLPVAFDENETGFAVCNTTGDFLGGGDHLALSESEIFFNPNFSWFFNRCSDGVVDSGAGFAEQCDDANRSDGDGCSSACAVEPGAVCNGEPSVCLPPAVPALGGPLPLLLLAGLVAGAGFAIVGRRSVRP